MTISRENLIRILGSEKVEKAESLSAEEFDELKWELLPQLLQAYEKIDHIPYFEARRSYLLGLPEPLQIALVRHIFEEEKITPL